MRGVVSGAQLLHDESSVDGAVFVQAFDDADDVIGFDLERVQGINESLEMRRRGGLIEDAERTDSRTASGLHSNVVMADRDLSYDDVLADNDRAVSLVDKDLGIRFGRDQRNIEHLGSEVDFERPYTLPGWRSRCSAGQSHGSRRVPGRTHPTPVVRSDRSYHPTLVAGR